MADVFPTSIVANPYLEELTASIRGKAIPWEGYHKASLITEDELRMLKLYESRTQQGSSQFLAQDGNLFAKLFITLLDKLVRVDTLQYLLVVVDDILEENREHAALFHQTSAENPKFPYEPFVKCLSKDDEFLSLKASKILSSLICTDKSRHQGVDLSQFINWIVTQLRSQNSSAVDIAVQNLESLLTVSECRQAFYQTNGVSILISLLKNSNGNPQAQYQLIFCFWLLSFEKNIAAEINSKYDIIPIFMDVAKTTVKEKVIRAVISTFRNLIEKAPEQNMAAMLVHKLLNFVENLASRKWSDADVPEDLEFVKVQLEENFHSLTTFDEYVSELESGKLSWTPPHQSEQFWQQNFSRLNENDYSLLRMLSRLLSTSSDPLVLAVGTHDIGQYVKHYPNGKKIVQEIGVKQRIMELMTHENPDVRYQALLAVQKLMVNAWDA
ncbi:ATPase V1 complex subunit H [Basidiobolus meristosporus CBS 931.73]|uniref:V-type proton ATPase subunit H n=1 Tax=Basidiobolus meristosporus CBS 931.73 TaxID=1314790 RepID=A0A1Y1XSV7_9FUNG|nr:ATPase V1 complex subunit H [Basidiobolus meristosporus CBS 931.73]|eukprot:ORX88831.1 ATPase V1 complex subunit H [Basidiobolus meristosporus CBS 931.73]